MSSLSIVNDSVVSRSDVLQGVLPVFLSANTDLSSGFGNSSSLYYICTAALTITLPTDFARHRGKIVNISSHVGAVSSAANVKTIAGGTTTTLCAGAGNWVTLLCDGSAWNIIMSD